MRRGEAARDRVRKQGPQTSLVTWALALLFLVAIDAALTRTSLLWGPTAFENSGGLRTVFPQTYQVLRKIYSPERDAETRVALLGNSRLALSAKERGVERALTQAAPERDVAVSNLAIFGSYIGDTAVLARHLGAMEPDLVVLSVGAVDLLRPALNPDAEGPTSLLEIGWREGPVPAAGWGDLVDRWARTASRLYRFREFVREAVLDRVLARPDPGPPPSEFDDTLGLFRHMYGERGDAIEAARNVFLAEPDLAGFARYVETVGPEHLQRQKDRARLTHSLDESSPSVVVLEMLLEELTSSGFRVVVLLMPEQPLLALDARGEYHRPGMAEQGASLVYRSAGRFGVPVIDARRWMPAECFLDFDHPIFELEHFEEPLAREILSALES
ncbi:MAG: hypothetical protein JRG96_12320 [Deltaproteobacteria bacterium]|nr:hypothetical protein [Deltaproteobacteria bacterium]